METAQFLNTQHCLAIAAAFIAIIAACTTLITNANNKAESLATRIREAMKEYREQSPNPPRCEQLQKEIYCFRTRFLRVQRVQSLLYRTIFIFIIPLAIFIGFGLAIIGFEFSEVTLHFIVRILFPIIGICVAFGTVCILIAVCLLYLEVRESNETLDIETEDCPILVPDYLKEKVPQPVPIG
jgi:hypothetical protein